MKALARRDGLRLPPGDPVHPEPQPAALPLPGPLAVEFVPLRVVLGPLNSAITAADEAVPRRPRARTEG